MSPTTKTVKLPTIRCSCGVRYLVFRDIRISEESFIGHRFRDFHEPDSEDSKECKFCRANLKAVRYESHGVDGSFRRGGRCDD